MTQKIRANLGDKFIDDDGNTGIVGILWDDGDFTVESVVMHTNPRLNKTEKKQSVHSKILDSQ